MNIAAYPLEWPTHWPRTTYPEPARFSTTLNNALNGVMFEMRLMGVRPSNYVVSTNIPVRLDGRPYANYRQPDDAGVAVYFVLRGHEFCIPSDKWNRVEHNMQAIRKTLEALRGIERWGTKGMMDASFQGFAALPGAAPRRSWWDVLGVDRIAPKAYVEARYRLLARDAHPDLGGNPDRFIELQNAYDEFRKERAA